MMSEGHRDRHLWEEVSIGEGRGGGGMKRKTGGGEMMETREGRDEGLEGKAVCEGKGREVFGAGKEARGKKRRREKEEMGYIKRELCVLLGRKREPGIREWERICNLADQSAICMEAVPPLPLTDDTLSFQG